MGAVNFSMDAGLVAALRSCLSLSVFVETGTFRGDTLASLSSSFPELHSVELSPEYFAAAQKRFTAVPHVHLHHGDSPRVLAKLVPQIAEKSVLYFLDAHWCVAADTAGEASQCPLLEEIRAIGSLNAESLVIIDDARLFLAPPLAPHEISQWPDFQDVLDALRAASPSHRAMVLNDNIIFFPPSAGNVLRAYAQQAGVDWLDVMSKIRDYDNLRDQFRSATEQLIEKEQVIQKIAERDKQIKHSILGRVWALYQANKFPKIGRLNLHAPIPLRLWGLPPTPGNRCGTPLPRISIVTPSYGQAEFIGRTMDSVLSQGYPNLEYFVQDGGSTDGTVEVLRRYSARLSGWESVSDRGQSHAINLGFAKTSGEIMAWLNSDDMLLPGTLAYVADYFAHHPEVDVVYGHRVLIDEDDKEIGRWILPRHSDATLSWADFIPQETLFWRRTIWETAGGEIDESFRFAMDWDLLLRFRDSGARMVRLPYFLGAFRIHQQQKTSAAINEIGHREMDHLRERVLGRRPSRREIRKAVLPFMLRHVAADIAYRIQVRLHKMI